MDGNGPHLGNWYVCVQFNQDEAIVIGTFAQQWTKCFLSIIELDCISVRLSAQRWAFQVVIDDTLSFNEHENNVYKSCNFLNQTLCHIHFGWYCKDHRLINDRWTTRLLQFFTMWMSLRALSILIITTMIPTIIYHLYYDIVWMIHNIPILLHHELQDLLTE